MLTNGYCEGKNVGAVRRTYCTFIARAWFGLAAATIILFVCGYKVGYAQQTVPKNIILMIGDGMGENHIRAANLYHHGAYIAQAYEDFPVRLFVSTYPAKMADSDELKVWSTEYNSAAAWSDFDYVNDGATDSAPAGTAMATGKKTYYKAIGVDAYHLPCENLCERAKALGKAAGVVTSVPWTHATPASFVAHNVNRDAYEEIAREMILSSRADVIMGAGHPMCDNDGRQKKENFDYKYVGGETLWTGLTSGSAKFAVSSIRGNSGLQDCDGDGTPDPWTLVETKAGVEQLVRGSAPRRVLGTAMVASTLQNGRGGDGKEDAYTVPFIQTVPSLKTMALGALNVLKNNPNGFFLMIEGGAIDWAAHSNQPGRLIEEQQEFNVAVDAVIGWIEKNGGWDENLLIVTADHETGYLTGPAGNDNSPESNPLVNNGQKKMPGMRFNSGNHTNQLVPLFANGAGSALFTLFADEHDYRRGYYINNTEIAQLVFFLWKK